MMTCDIGREYERFVKAVASMMGGQLPPQELLEVAAAVWRAVQGAPKPDEAAAKRISLVNLHRSHRSWPRGSSQPLDALSFRMCQKKKGCCCR